VSVAADLDAVRRLPTHLRDRYAIDVTKVSAIQGGHLFRVDRGDGPSWVARPFPPARPQERAERDAAVLRYLESIDYPAERCAHAEPLSTLNGWTILVSTFVEGHPPGNAGRANVPLDVFVEHGRLLGLLHSTPLPDELKRPAGSWHGDPAFEGAPREDIAAARAWLSEVEQNVAPDGSDALASLREQIDELDDCGDLPHAFVHPDFCAVNSITASDGHQVIVDWTGSGWGPRLNSLANLLVHTLGPHAGTADHRLDTVLDAYAEHVELMPDEIDALGPALRIRTLLFACYTYRIVVQSGSTPTGAEGWWPDHRATDALATKVAARAAKRS
jgi:Ser/Thr protein kinase RdoA (MazF antagonist)